MGTQVYKPEEVYRNVLNVAPDLIVHFGGLSWRSIGSVGYSSLHIQVNDPGYGSCNHAQFGAFILAAPGSPLEGEISGAHLLDDCPTLLGWAGTISLQHAGAFVVCREGFTGRCCIPAEDEAILRERLSGLGYIS
jgi:predicted AlkP superfamily phosphohydrolase/phosphomutase